MGEFAFIRPKNLVKPFKGSHDSIDVILNNMRRKPEDWWMDDYHARHRSGVSIWIGNGISNYHVQEPNFQELGWSDRLKLRKALKKLREEIPLL